jgi:hypothetical protein
LYRSIAGVSARVVAYIAMEEWIQQRVRERERVRERVREMEMFEVLEEEGGGRFVCPLEL